MPRRPRVQLNDQQFGPSTKKRFSLVWDHFEVPIEPIQRQWETRVRCVEWNLSCALGVQGSNRFKIFLVPNLSSKICGCNFFVVTETKKKNSTQNFFNSNQKIGLIFSIRTEVNLKLAVKLAVNLKLAVNSHRVQKLVVNLKPGPKSPGHKTRGPHVYKDLI